MVGDVGQTMQQLAEVAVADGKRSRGLELDYSPESIKHVERALGQVHEALRARRISDEKAEELCYPLWRLHGRDNSAKMGRFLG